MMIFHPLSAADRQEVLTLSACLLGVVVIVRLVLWATDFLDD